MFASSPRFKERKFVPINVVGDSEDPKNNRWQQQRRGEANEPSEQVVEPVVEPVGCRDVMLMVIFVGSTVVYTVFDKLVSISLGPNFPFAKSTLTTVNTVVLGYPLMLLLQWWRGKFTVAENGGGIKAAFLVGALFAMSNVLNDLGNRGHVIPGEVGVLIGKLCVPAALLVDSLPCMFRPHTRYHYAGAAVIVAGVAGTLATEFSSLHFGDSAELVVYLLMLIVAIIPAAFGVAVAGSYLENHPNTSNMYFWSWVVLSEVLVLPPLAFLNAWVVGLPVTGPAVWDNIVDGLSCLVTTQGYRTSDHPAVQCGRAAFFFWCSYPCCVAFNLCIPALARKPALGAPVVYILRAIALPVSFLLFCVPFIMGSDVEPLQWTSAVGLGVVTSALILYYAQDIRRWLKKTFSGGDESDIYHDLDDESESPAERERESDSSYHALIDETPNRI